MPGNAIVAGRDMGRIPEDERPVERHAVFPANLASTALTSLSLSFPARELISHKLKANEARISASLNDPLVRASPQSTTILMRSRGFT